LEIDAVTNSATRRQDSNFMDQPKTATLKQRYWTATLVLALLFAQFAGLQHRIAHSGRQGDPSFSQSQAGSDTGDTGKTNDTHSCVMFDAATLAATVNATPCVPLLAAGAEALAQPVVPASWNAPVFHHFLSRAPPLVVL
jgi:hypothetical protein